MTKLKQLLIQQRIPGEKGCQNIWKNMQVKENLMPKRKLTGKVEKAKTKASKGEKREIEE